MLCSFCKRDLKIVARDLCKNCYQRWHKRGSAEYADRHRTFCHIDDCGKPVVSNGMCDMHRQRLRKTGSTDKSDWGTKAHHPLRHSHDWIMRYRSQHPVDRAWGDFLQFAMDVGERPSPKHKLYSADDSRPIGPGNFVWKEAITQRVEDEDERTYMNRAQKVYRAIREEAYKGYELKKNYGLNRGGYAEMAEKQGHKCAICGGQENYVIRGKKLSMAVDHCHASGAVRALLCSGCNRGLGLFRDDPAILRAAAAYLEKHTLQPTQE